MKRFFPILFFVALAVAVLSAKGQTVTVVNNVSNLLALAPNPQKPLVDVLGASTANDGGGARVVWVAASTAATNTWANGGPVARPFGSATGRYLRLIPIAPPALTTTQRDALTPTAGSIIWNTTTARINNYTGSAWTDGWVRLGGDTMTGPLEIQNGAAQQFARVYGTYDTAGANYRRATLTMTTAGNMQLRSEGLGTGATGNTFDIFVNGTSVLQLSAAGTATFTGGVQMGQASTFQFAGRTRATSPADGILLLTDQAITSFTGISLGGTTASFPQIRRNAAGIDAKVADNSAFAPVQSLYDRYGAGAPEGVVTAPVGTTYHRTDGGANTSLYVKESGTGNTGWVAK